MPRGDALIRLLWALASRCFRPDPFGEWWRKHVIDDCPPHLDTCESCREVSCDCTKVKTCNQLHGLRPYQQAAIDDIKASPRHATYIPTGIGKGGMPVGRRVGRPTRRT
jgi:hypothetical protein